MSDNGTLRTADIQRIMQLLPHRYPFLLIDRIVDMNEDQSCVGIKNVTINEPFFQGHFPVRPVMPGVLLIEAMAQTAGALALDHMGVDAAGQLVFFMTIDNAKFRKPVGPGDTVHFHVQQTQKRGPVYKFACEAKVDGTKVAQAEIGAMLASDAG